MKRLTRAKALELMIKLQENSDLEYAHRKADELLCLLLAQKGMADIVAEYHKVNKWYA